MIYAMTCQGCGHQEDLVVVRFLAHGEEYEGPECSKCKATKWQKLKVTTPIDNSTFLAKQCRLGWEENAHRALKGLPPK
jgi:hypothetical protein